MAEIALTLRRRSRELTLPDRRISGGSTSGNLASFAVLQGFRYQGAFNRKVFLLYGLVGDLYDGAPDSTLTLRRRPIALTLGG